MIDLIRNHAYHLVSEEKSLEFSGPISERIFELEADNYILQTIQNALLKEAEKSGVIIKPNTELEKKLSWIEFIIPFTGTVKCKLNPEIKGYTIKINKT